MTREEIEVIAAVRRLVAAEIAAGRGRVIDAELRVRLAPGPEPARVAVSPGPLAPARTSAPGSASAPVSRAAPVGAAATAHAAAAFGATAPGSTASAVAAAAPAPPAAGPDQAARAARLAALTAEVEACTRCALATTRTKVVVGVGRLDPGLLLVGEAPGADEDRVGEPFVGRAGQLLTRILAAIGLERGDVYIANVLKCRPPENRNPLPGEIAACSPYLAEQIALVRPRVIAALGRFAAATLLRTHQTTLSALRGRIHDYQGIPVVVTYHPSALLRYPMYKKPTWEDMQVIQRLLAGQSAAEALVAASPDA